MSFRNLFKDEPKPWWKRLKNWFFPPKVQDNLVGVDFILIKEPTPEQYKNYYDRVKAGESLHSLKQEHLEKCSTVAYSFSGKIKENDEE